MSPAEPVEHFDKSRHDVRSFDCGYSLLATSIEHGQATQPLQAGTPVYFPIPMCLLARLA